ncbi:MAG TPA: YbaB/EbfC family nucleoid-associated protein [Thermoanaerobaculia bacterium]|nr:YbaB/EbfC family nucleoid-associated protein [Thermoanaerobaculia bacterium]
MMKQAQQMQQKLQEEVEALEVEAAVGGGLVTVRMSGRKQLLAVTIDPEVLDPTDPRMVEDLVLSAVNEAGRKVDDALQQRLGSLPGLGGIPGIG